MGSYGFGVPLEKTIVPQIYQYSNINMVVSFVIYTVKLLNKSYGDFEAKLISFQGLIWFITTIMC